MSYIRVKDKKNLYRDSKTNAIVNKNDSEYQKYLTQRSKKLQQDNDIEILKSEVSSLRNDIGEIKILLKLLTSSK
jgi:hypothetical protein